MNEDLVLDCRVLLVNKYYIIERLEMSSIVDSINHLVHNQHYMKTKQTLNGHDLFIFVWPMAACVNHHDQPHVMGTVKTE